jgi:4-deoxy-L-threo-5-hexosulose-uronate ketol-isomerase
LGTGYFLERRELGAINVGGEGEIVADGIVYSMKKLDGIYIGAGTKDVSFRSLDKDCPAKFYVNSAPAHQTYPTVHIPLEKARKVELGNPENLNVRTIHQIVHPAVCPSCQLVMGVTILKPGSVWNSMPSHTHARRMEVYFYFDMAETTRIFHFMGEPTETRHLILKNEEAVISPSWSIHSGVGTSNYTFIWGMCGENQTFDDMDFVDLKSMR